MEFQVLGPVRVRHGDRLEVLSGRLQGTLLAVLLARADQPVSVDLLTDTLWNGRPDSRAPQKLQLHVHRLRGVLDDPDRLTFDAAGYRLRARPDEIDAERFDELVETGTAAAARDPQRAIESLRAALALWRGMPFADSEVPVLADWARRLAERRLTGMESLYQAQLACGLHTAVISELTDLVREHPLRERLHELLMTAQYGAGRRSEALEVYSRARQALVSELGLEPGPELRELHRRVLAGDLPTRTAGAPADRREVPAQLPVDVRGFVGRQAQLAELTGSLSDATICAVTGTAGVGKTALAVRWARGVRDRFPDGQLYVDLRGYGPDEPVSAAEALAGFLRSLGLDGKAIPENLDERASLFRTLIDQRRMLILLDNARTVDQLRPLLPAGPTCFTLVTSRDSLAGLVARYGAHRIVLGRLSFVDAVGLLRELLGSRADAEQAAVGALAERCARLPLALRVSAELVRSRSGRTVGDLVDELADQQDALDLLDVDGDPHTAVRAVFSWSYRQLRPEVALVFRLFGLHPGHDADAYAVAAMAGTSLRETRRALDVLVRAHLVDELSGGRYQPHDLLRAYAAELVTTAETVVARGAALTRLFDYYLATASAAMDLIAPHEAPRRPRITAPDVEVPRFETYDAAFDWLGGDRVNLLIGTEHAGPDYTIRMAETVWRYLAIGGYSGEDIELQKSALRAAATLEDPLAEANARRVVGSAMLRVGLVSQGADHLARALELYERIGALPLQAATLTNLGVIHWWRGDLAAATTDLRRAIKLFESDGLRPPAMNNLARILCTLGQYDEAHGLFERSLMISRHSANRISEASALTGLARVAADTDRPEAVLSYARQALAVAESTGYRSHTGTATRYLGIAHRQLGEYELATRHLESALRIARQTAEPDETMSALNELAATHASTGNTAEAIRYFGETLTIENGQGHHRDLYAHALAGLSDVHTGLGEPEQAREYWRQALVIYRDLGMPHAARRPAGLDAAAQGV